MKIAKANDTRLNIKTSGFAEGGTSINAHTDNVLPTVKFSQLKRTRNRRIRSIKDTSKEDLYKEGSGTDTLNDGLNDTTDNDSIFSKKEGIKSANLKHQAPIKGPAIKSKNEDTGRSKKTTIYTDKKYTTTKNTTGAASQATAKAAKGATKAAAKTTKKTAKAVTKTAGKAVKTASYAASAANPASFAVRTAKKASEAATKPIKEASKKLKEKANTIDQQNEKQGKSQATNIIQKAQSAVLKIVSIVIMALAVVLAPVLIILIVILIILIVIIVIICVIITLFTWIAEQLSATPTNFTENEKIIYSYLKENTDYGNTQIAAIMGNLKAELSSNDPTYDTGNVLGIMQWTGASRSAIVGWASANNKDVYTLETQLEYATTVYIPNSWRFPSTYTGKKAYPSSYNISYTAWQALGEEDIDLATAAFCACSEKPYYYNSNIDSLRIPYARTYLASIKAQQNADPNAPTSSDIAYVQYALNMAADDSIGYSQARRNRNPDVDCSSFVAWALKDAGYNITPANMYTGNERSTLTRLGFSVLSYNASDLQAGDILWRNGHTEIYVGNGYSVGAHSDNGYPQSGDQTGSEVSVSVASTSWTLIFRKN